MCLVFALDRHNKTRYVHDNAERTVSCSLNCQLFAALDIIQLLDLQHCVFIALLRTIRIIQYINRAEILHRVLHPLEGLIPHTIPFEMCMPRSEKKLLRQILDRMDFFKIPLCSLDLG